MAIVLLLFCIWAAPKALWAAAPLELGPTVGAVIDRQERQRYRLFPDIERFESAQLFTLDAKRFRVNYAYWSGTQLRQARATLPLETLQRTRIHLEVCERFFKSQRSTAPASQPRPATFYWLALRYGAETRYDLAVTLLQDLSKDYPQSAWADSAATLLRDIEQLGTPGDALYLPGALLDQTGRTDLLVFGGYYGLWLGLATPVAFKADSSPPYAAGLLLGPPLGFWSAHKLTARRSISPARATQITFAAHLGTWQGLGWGAVADLSGSRTVAAGQIAGLAGLAASSLLSSRWQPSQGHIGLINAAAYWGAWGGLVTALAADHDGDDLLRDMLLGSDALVLIAALGAKKTTITDQRIRLLNLAGVLGGAFGLGLDLLFQVDDQRVAGLTAGAGSLLGLWAGLTLTKPPPTTALLDLHPALLGSADSPAPGARIFWAF